MVSTEQLENAIRTHHVIRRGIEQHAGLCHDVQHLSKALLARHAVDRVFSLDPHPISTPLVQPRCFLPRPEGGHAF